MFMIDRFQKLLSTIMDGDHLLIDLKIDNLEPTKIVATFYADSWDHLCCLSKECIRCSMPVSEQVALF